MQALAKGTNIPSVGSVKISWHNATNPVPKPTSAPQTVQATEKKPPSADDERPLSPRLDDPQDDGGWGNEDDIMF